MLAWHNHPNDRGGDAMNTHYAAMTATTQAAPELRLKAELVLWLVGMAIASLYVFLN